METPVNSGLQVPPTAVQHISQESEVISNPEDASADADLAAKQYADAENATLNSKIMIIDDEQLVF